MTVCDDCFREFLHPIFHKLMDKNNQFFERYGRHVRWDWDDVAATLTFSDPVLPTVRIDVTVVGSTEGNSWEWSWANPNYQAYSKRDMEKIREFGEKNRCRRIHRLGNDRCGSSLFGRTWSVPFSYGTRVLLSHLS
jgi:hypothetical protein